MVGGTVFPDMNLWTSMHIGLIHKKNMPEIGLCQDLVLIICNLALKYFDSYIETYILFIKLITVLLYYKTVE